MFGGIEKWRRDVRWENFYGGMWDKNNLFVVVFWLFVFIFYFYVFNCKEEEILRKNEWFELWKYKWN